MPGVSFELTARAQVSQPSGSTQFIYLGFTSERFRHRFTNVKSGTRTIPGRNDAISVRQQDRLIILFASSLAQAQTPRSTGTTSASAPGDRGAATSSIAVRLAKHESGLRSCCVTRRLSFPIANEQWVIGSISDPVARLIGRTVIEFTQLPHGPKRNMCGGCNGHYTLPPARRFGLRHSASLLRRLHRDGTGRLADEEQGTDDLTLEATVTSGSTTDRSRNSRSRASSCRATRNNGAHHRVPPGGYDSKLPSREGPGAQVGGRTRTTSFTRSRPAARSNLPRGNYMTERVWLRCIGRLRRRGAASRSSRTSTRPLFPRASPSRPHHPPDGRREPSGIRSSHDANRTQGEHVVELAHLIGVDMTTRIWSATRNAGNIDVPVKVPVGERRTRGKRWNVDRAKARRVKRPTTNVKMFQRGARQDFPAWVLPLRRRFERHPTDHCAETGLTNRYDTVAGPGGGGSTRSLAVSAVRSCDERVARTQSARREVVRPAQLPW